MASIKSKCRSKFCEVQHKITFKAITFPLQPANVQDSASSMKATGPATSTARPGVKNEMKLLRFHSPGRAMNACWERLAARRFPCGPGYVFGTTVCGTAVCGELRVKVFTAPGFPLKPMERYSVMEVIATPPIFGAFTFIRESTEWPTACSDIPLETASGVHAPNVSRMINETQRSCNTHLPPSDQQQKAYSGESK